MDGITVFRLVDQLAFQKRFAELARFAGPLGGQLDIGNVADKRVAFLVADIPQAFEVAPDMRHGGAEEMDEPLEFRMMPESWTRHFAPLSLLILSL